MGSAAVEANWPSSQQPPGQADSSMAPVLCPAKANPLVSKVLVRCLAGAAQEQPASPGGVRAGAIPRATDARAGEGGFPLSRKEAHLRAQIV